MKISKKLMLIVLITIAMAIVPSVNATITTQTKTKYPIKAYYLPGEKVTFELNLTVQSDAGGSFPITDLNATDILPDYMTFVTGEQTSTPSSTFTDHGNGTLFWDFGAGPFYPQQLHIKFNATIDSDAPGGQYLTNDANFEYYEYYVGPPENYLYKNPGVSTQLLVIFPILDIDKVCSGKILEGGNIEYNITLTNTGYLDAEGVEVTDYIPSGVNYTGGASATSGSFTVENDTHVIWTGTIGNVTGVNTVNITIPVTDNATIISDSIINIVNYTDYPAADFVKMSDSCTTTVIHPGILIDKTGPDKVMLGDEVVYKFNLTNTGDVALNVVVDDDKLGAGIWKGSLAAKSSVQWSNTTTPGSTGTITNNATATGTHQLGDVSYWDTHSVEVVELGILIDKTGPDKVMLGDDVVYKFNLTNTGSVALDVVVDDDKLGAGIWKGSVAAKSSVQWSNTTTAKTTGTITNNATATGTYQTDDVSDWDTHSVEVVDPGISITKKCTPGSQVAVDASITWEVNITNTGDVALAVVAFDSHLGWYFSDTLNPGESNVTTYVEGPDLPPGSYDNYANVTGTYQLRNVTDEARAVCKVDAVYILKQFVNATVLPEGLDEGFGAEIVNATNIQVYGLHTGPKTYFTVQYYFENSLNFLGDDFDGMAHNFTLWDKWGGNLMGLGSPPVAFDQKSNVITLEDGSEFDIDPRKDDYRIDYIGDGLNVSDLASQGDAWITMHSGDQQEGTNPGKGGGKKPDNGKSYDVDVAWWIGELGVNESATLVIYIAPGKNPGGKLQFSSPGCTIINTGPRVRVYGDSFDDEDFMYAVSRTNTLTVCVEDIRLIRITGYDTPRARNPLANSTSGNGSDDLYEALLDPSNFGSSGVVDNMIVFEPFVQTVETGSLVIDGKLKVHVFFDGLSGTNLTAAEAQELDDFVDAGGILYMSGNSGFNEGPNYNPFFASLGWTDKFNQSTQWAGNQLPTSIPLATPVTTGPFGIVGNLTHTPFRIIYTDTPQELTSVALGYINQAVTHYTILAEGEYGEGYISVTGDPLYFNQFTSVDADNLNYFLNLIALAAN